MMKKYRLYLFTVILICSMLASGSEVNSVHATSFVVDFSFPTPVTVGSPVTFNATASGNTGSLSFEWRLLDGTFLGTGNFPVRVFSTPGIQIVALRVYDAGSGANAYASHSVNVQPSPVTVDLSAPTGGIFGYPGVDTVGSPVTFTGTALGGSPPYRFDWNFSDGTKATGVHPTRTFSSAG